MNPYESPQPLDEPPKHYCWLCFCEQFWFLFVPPLIAVACLCVIACLPAMWVFPLIGRCEQSGRWVWRYVWLFVAMIVVVSWAAFVLTPACHWIINNCK